jgi:hypothetical protein
VTDGQVFVIDGRPGLSIEWTNSNQLTISFKPEKDRRGVFKQETSWEDITIHYETERS